MPDFITATPAQLAAVVRGLRAECGLTQRQAAARVSLLPKTVSALESHPERSTLASLFKLLSALDAELLVRPKSAQVAATDGEDW